MARDRWGDRSTGENAEPVGEVRPGEQTRNYLAGATGTVVFAAGGTVGFVSTSMTGFLPASGVESQANTGKVRTKARPSKATRFLGICVFFLESLMK